MCTVAAAKRDAGADGFRVVRNKRGGNGSFFRSGPDLINPVSAVDSDAAAYSEGVGGVGVEGLAERQWGYKQLAPVSPGWLNISWHSFLSVEGRLALLSIHHGPNAEEGEPLWKCSISIYHSAPSEQHWGN